MVLGVEEREGGGKVCVRYFTITHRFHRTQSWESSLGFCIWLATSGLKSNVALPTTLEKYVAILCIQARISFSLFELSSLLVPSCRILLTKMARRTGLWRADHPGNALQPDSDSTARS